MKGCLLKLDSRAVKLPFYRFYFIFFQSGKKKRGEKGKKSHFLDLKKKSSSHHRQAVSFFFFFFLSFAMESNSVTFFKGGASQTSRSDK